MSAVAGRARAVVRANARATVVLALVAGVLGGLVLATWSASRRAESSFDRFLEATEQPNIALGFCPPDATFAEMRRGCPRYDPVREAGIIRGLAGVRAATRGSLVYGVYDIGGEDVPGPVFVAVDATDLATPEGRPILTEGRLVEPAKADEVVVGEEAAKLYGLRVGDEVPFTLHRTGAEDPYSLEATGPTVRFEVVGIIRTTRDIVALTDSQAAEFSDSVPVAGPAFWEQYGDLARTWGVQVYVSVRDSEVDDLERSLQRAFPGRSPEPETISVPERTTVNDAIGYETAALRVMAVAGTVAFLLSVGLALLRQATQERAEAATLNALGMTRVQLLGAAGLRAAPVGVLAALVAIIVATTASLVTSIGVSGRAEIDRGLHVDPVASAIGAIAVALLTVLAMVVPSMVPARRLGATRAARAGKGIAGLGASLSAGRGLMRSRAHSALSLRLAGFTCVVAVACSVAASGLIGSLGDLTSHPESYGTSWSAAVWGEADPFLEGDFDAAVQAVRDTRDAHAAAGLNIDPESWIGALRVPTVAFWTIVGAPQEWSVVVAGREPREADEVSLGPKTMRAVGVGIGDEISLSGRRVEVVGESLFHDGMQIEPGEVAVVDASWFGDARDRGADNILLRSSAARPDWGPIEEAGFTVVVPPPPAGVRNLMRIDGAPELLGLIVSLLAAAVLAHTVLAFTRIERRQLSILRAIGCTPRQVIEAVVSVVVLIVCLGVVLGVPLGWAFQDWIWSTLARRIAFSSPNIWVGEVAGIALAAVVVGVAVGASAGWLAVRRPAARALRDE